MARNSKTHINLFSETVSQILQDYGDEVKQAVDDCAKETMDELVDLTKWGAPINSHGKKEHYRDQIASKEIRGALGGKSYLWYVNGNKWSLAHLLNTGHAKRGGGRVKGDFHVTKVAERIMQDYEKNVKEAIRNCGA